jgi:hypothetical protein
MLSTAAAQAKPPVRKPATRTTKPTTTVPVSKGEAPPPVRPETVYVTRRDTITNTVYRRDTVTVTGPTITRWDTVTVTEVPGWLGRGNGAYFGLGAGPFYPSAGLGRGQIPGYSFQMNLGVDPAGSPIGLRATALLARPDESQPFSGAGGRPTLTNGTVDLKLRLPMFSASRFPQFGLYAVGGLAYVHFNNVRFKPETGPGVLVPTTDNHAFGYDAGAGATMSLGHKRELFLEARVINFKKDFGGANYEGNHQLPVILGVNWY